MRAGSLLVSLFGDAIAPRGGAITLGSLIPLAEPFGVAERLVRTSVARLAQEGWFTTRRNGRLSEYALTDVGTARFAEAARRIYALDGDRWDGTWTIIVFPSWPVPKREEVRYALRFAGFGEPLAGAFVHPSVTVEEATTLLTELRVQRLAVVMRSDPGVPATSPVLVNHGWDLSALDRRYRAFLRGFEPMTAASTIDPEPAFVLRTLLIHEYRRIHLLDPGLPRDLLPAGWAGATAQRVCQDIYFRVFAPAEHHLDRVARRLEGPLPRASAEAWARFGGIPADRGGARA
jgi:phenylacetic acid degradation operon negative regulatory protein